MGTTLATSLLGRAWASGASSERFTIRRRGLTATSWDGRSICARLAGLSIYLKQPATRTSATESRSWSNRWYDACDLTHDIYYIPFILTIFCLNNRLVYG